MIDAIFVNLPITDVSKTRAFWSQLGFSFNEQFSDDKALCLELNPPFIYAMLLSEPFFQTFTHRPVADRSATQVLLTIQVNSREKVDSLVALALKNGAQRYNEPIDYGWMYNDSFSDIDGHQWEVMFGDTSQMPDTKGE